jgi:hypothetical protein
LGYHIIFADKYFFDHAEPFPPERGISLIGKPLGAALSAGGWVY